MERVAPPVSSTDDLSPPLRQRGGGGAKTTLLLWARRHNTLLTIASASIAPILYLLYIDHYVVNTFIVDDWSVVPLVHGALHGHLSLSLLWSQYNEDRLVIGNLIDVLFGFTDRLDERAISFFNAAVLIASYIGLLALVRTYTSKRLTPIPVLAIGVIWFSLADYENTVWAFQVSWYLTVFFFVMTLCALLIPERRRPLWLASAALLAVAASLSTVQGFLCWPIGLICILWHTSWRRVRPEIATWLIAMLVTMGLYLHGYTFTEGNICIPAVQCTTTFELHHPLTLLAFFFALIGNVIPGHETLIPLKVDDPARFVLVGTVLFATSLYILVQSWRHRASSERLPLPGLVIAFALLFDLTLVVGRGGTGVFGAVNDGRYVMANLILLTGIVIWVLARLPKLHLSATSSPWRVAGTSLILSALAVFLLVQVTDATAVGVSYGRVSAAARIGDARAFVNTYPSCLLNSFVPFFRSRTVLRDGAEDHLGEYGPTTYRYFRELGPTANDIYSVNVLNKKFTQITGKPAPRCFLPPIAPSSR
jgi:hypothetical protein